MPSCPLDDAERRDWLRLANSENVGPATFRLLLERFGTAKQALEALPELSRRGGLQRPIRLYPSEKAESDLENADAIGARFVGCSEPDYPPLLQHIDLAPPLLCIRGNADIARRPVVAMVGARNATALGRKFTRQITAELAAAGSAIVSGLARGIDTAAHEASLETGTIAVVAGGLDIIYPPENQVLHEQIAEHGLLVSEMVPGTRPRADYFPRRNRIISGVSLAVVVVEAAVKSGSLITARLANEQGREVFAVPGSPMDPRAGGTNKLIRDGAHLCTGARDVLDELEALHTRKLPEMPGFRQDGNKAPGFSSGPVSNDDRERIAALLGAAPVEIDDLIRESGETAQTVLAILLELELAGRVTRHGRQRVSLA